MASAARLRTQRVPSLPRRAGVCLPEGERRMSRADFSFWKDAAFSSATEEWATPKWLFDELHKQFGFELDVCATDDNAKCSRYFTKELDGLSRPWTGVCWMNPPYGETIGLWMEKACRAAEKGATVVCLVPARTDTSWWHDWAMKGEVRFLRGRLKFGDAKNSAPFPSAIVVFRPPALEQVA